MSSIDRPKLREWPQLIATADELGTSCPHTGIEGQERARPCCRPEPRSPSGSKCQARQTPHLRACLPRHRQCQAGRQLAAQCHTRTADPRRPVLLRRHVDAAGAPDRLLRRSRLRPGARRRDAGGDARLWRGKPSDLRLGAQSRRGLPTLLLGSTMQAIALALYIAFDGLVAYHGRSNLRVGIVIARIGAIEWQRSGQ